jgi:GT2 family glycosyltransferase
MSLYVLIPVFNRLLNTKSIVNQLSAQVINEDLKIIIIDDGSTDGTTDFLKSCTSVIYLKGTGFLYWGGAISLGLEYLKHYAVKGDWVLLLNNDTTIDVNYCQALVDIARENYPAAIGTILRNSEPPFKILSYGALANPWTFTTTSKVKIDNEASPQKLIPSQLLSGRGTLYPYDALAPVPRYFSKLFPHYFGDYWLSLYAKKLGYFLYMTQAPATYSLDHFGSNIIEPSLFDSIFSKRSPNFLLAKLFFWWSISNQIQKITLPLRMILFILAPRLRNFFDKQRP